MPSFTVAQLNTATAQIADYTVMSVPDRKGTTFAKEYTFSETYGMEGLTPKSLRAIITEMQNDLTLSMTMSQSYLRNWSVGAVRNQIQPIWPGYVFGMDKMDSSAYKHCVCEGPLGDTLK